MDIRNCRKCGRIFNYVMGPTICPDCQKKQEEKFQEVKKYISENHSAYIPQIAIYETEQTANQGKYRKRYSPMSKHIFVCGKQ